MLQEVFGTNKPVIGVIHLLPLPGSSRYEGHLEEVLSRAEQEAAALATGGADGIIVENFFDAPFAKNRVDTATACAIALAAERVRNISGLPVGINVLRNDGHSALAVAATTGASFVRINVFTGAMLTDQGVIEGEAHDLLLYRKLLGAEHRIHVLADVMVKHATPLGQAQDIRQAAKDAVERGLADAIIVSGVATGEPPNSTDLRAVKEVLPDTPVLVGSGAAAENVSELLATADGIIVASSIKRQGLLKNPVDADRLRALIRQARSGALPSGQAG